MVLTIVNQTGIIGSILTAGSNNLTGNLAATLFLILMIFLAIAMMFRIPLEIFALIILPFCIAAASFEGNFMIVIVVIVMYLGFIIAKNWLFK